MIGKDRQTVVDLAMVHGGSAECMFSIARRNNVSVDSEVSGMELADVEVYDRQVVNFYANKNQHPSSLYHAPGDDDNEESQQFILAEDGTFLTTDNGINLGI